MPSTADSGTAPNSAERRDACRKIAQARGYTTQATSDFVDDCAGMQKLVFSITPISIKRLPGFLDEKCLSATVIKTVPVNPGLPGLRSTIEIRNQCEAMLFTIFGTRSENDILSQLHLGSHSQRAFWPQYNAVPTLSFTPIRDLDPWVADVIAKNGAFEYTVDHEPNPSWEAQVKIGACAFIKNGVNQVVFRDVPFTNFVCYPVPPAKRSPTQDQFLGTLAGQGSGKPAAAKPAPKTAKP